MGEVVSLPKVMSLRRINAFTSSSYHKDNAFDCGDRIGRTVGEVRRLWLDFISRGESMLA